MSATDTNVGGSTNIRAHYSTALEYNSDSVEWCPHAPHRDLCAIGNYQLNEAAKQKLGCIYLYQLQTTAAGATPLRSLHSRQQLSTCAVLDLKWSHTQSARGESQLAMAGVDGSVHVYTLTAAQQLQQTHTIDITRDHSPSSPLLCLALDWSNRVDRSSAQLIVSDTAGRLSLVDTHTMQVTQQWQAHELEAWCCAFNHYNTNVMYSGADDALLKSWDQRSFSYNNTATTAATAAATNRSHGAGVCSIHCSPHTEHLMATGSYDETLRIFDVRALSRPLDERKLHGGVWRVKWHPNNNNSSNGNSSSNNGNSSNNQRIVAACMHNGVHVLDVTTTTTADHSNSSSSSTGNLKSCTITAGNVSSYMQHTSLAYGVDWCCDEKESALIASCSFYDNQLHLWSIHTEEQEQM